MRLDETFIESLISSNSSRIVDTFADLHPLTTVIG